MVKKMLIILLTFIIVLSAFPSFSFAAETQNMQQAEDLFKLGLLLSSNGDFALKEKVTRAQGAVMMVRLLGKEEEARNSNYLHPFTDVPSYASPYVGYCYKHGLTSGVSKNAYGTTQDMTVEQYVTFVLRALGYSDSKGDFTLPTSIQKATEISLLSTNEANKLKSSSPFMRNDMVLISYNALVTRLKNQDQTLVKKLLSENVIEKENLDRTQLLIPERLDGTGFDILNKMGHRVITTKVGYILVIIILKQVNIIKSV